MKKVIGVAIGLLLCFASVYFVSARECLAPNAIWLKPEMDSLWTLYELERTDQGYLLKLPYLEEGAEIYLAYPYITQHWFRDSVSRHNIVDLDKSVSWIQSFDKNRPYSFVGYWQQLEKQNPEDLFLKECFGNILYVKLSNDLWYKIMIFVAPYEDRQAIPLSGLLLTSVHESLVESDLYECTRSGDSSE